jgi:hypothetical protein
MNWLFLGVRAYPTASACGPVFFGHPDGQYEFVGAFGCARDVCQMSPEDGTFSTTSDEASRQTKRPHMRASTDVGNSVCGIILAENDSAPMGPPMAAALPEVSGADATPVMLESNASGTMVLQPDVDCELPQEHTLTGAPLTNASGTMVLVPDGSSTPWQDSAPARVLQTNAGGTFLFLAESGSNGAAPLPLEAAGVMSAESPQASSSAARRARVTALLDARAQLPAGHGGQFGRTSESMDIISPLSVVESPVSHSPTICADDSLQVRQAWSWTALFF